MDVAWYTLLLPAGDGARATMMALTPEQADVLAAAPLIAPRSSGA